MDSMSVLIKGVKPPDSCFECPFRGVDEELADFCRVPTFEFIWCKYDKRSDDCPLVEIPKHGRLIDADAQRNIFAKLEFSSDMGDAMEILDNAPTVIEAEE